MPTADEAYLEQVKKLVKASKETPEEAVIYFGLIQDLTLKKEAQILLESL